MVLSMSLSGALLILLLFFGERIMKNRLSRQWQYYIWLVVLMRLLLPFGPEASLMGQVYQAGDGVIAQMSQKAHLTAQNSGRDCEQESGQSPVLRNPQTAPAGKYLWVIWLVVALGMLIRKISLYQRYIRCVRAGAEPVSDLALLDRLAETAQKLGIGRAVELSVNPHVASPMMVGCFHPCIVLPCAEVQERKFCYMAMHELIHYKRRDILYKWLVQLTVCLHWFNPFVYLMRREMERACEFSCDEAVVAQMGYDHAADYGETLLDAMAVGTCREPFAAVTMSANKELLRERLGAIMSRKKKTKITGIITIGLTMCVALGAFFLGVYPAAEVETETFPQEMVVAMPVCRIREGAGEAFQVVDLIAEGETVTVLGKEEGKDGQMWYLLDKDSLAEQSDDSAKECYIRADLLGR